MFPMRSSRIFMTIPDKGYQLEFLYGVVTVRDAASDEVIKIFQDVVELYEWLEGQLTDEQLQSLVGDMQEFLLQNTHTEEAH